MGSNWDIKQGLDELASLLEFGQLKLATDPADFIRDVVSEVKRLRKVVEAGCDGDPILDEMAQAAELVCGQFGRVDPGSYVGMLVDALTKYKKREIHLEDFRAMGINPEVVKLRKEQTRRAAPHVGNVLDMWEQLPNDLKTDPDLEALARALDSLNEAMEGDEAPESSGTGSPHVDALWKGLERKDHAQD